MRRVLLSAQKLSVAVIGAGAAGLAAAIEALRAGASVSIFELNAQPARRLRLLGRGFGAIARNDADFSHFHGKHARFVQDALRAFDPAWFKKLKIILETDEGSGEVRVPGGGGVLVDAMVRACRRAKRNLATPVVDLRRDNNGFEIELATGKRMRADRVVLATGGVHAPQLGVTGGGHELAAASGHTLEETGPALVGVRVAQHWPGRLPGLWMNVVATLFVDGKDSGQSRGLLLFTRNSLTGPGVFGFSREIELALVQRKRVEISLNFYPEMTAEQVARWQFETFGQHARMELAKAMDRMIPMRLALELLKLCGLPPQTRVHVMGLREREVILERLLGTRVTVAATLGLRAALGSRGGVSVREVDPRTFESKVAPGLFIAGEMLAGDGTSLAVNRQFALASGMLAGRAASL